MKNDKLSTFGSRLRAARKEAGMTQKDFAALSGIPSRTLTGWENNKYSPKLKDLFIIHNILGVSIDYLLGLREQLPDVAYISLKTGLSRNTVQTLQALNTWENYAKECNGCNSSTCVSSCNSADCEGSALIYFKEGRKNAAIINFIFDTWFPETLKIARRGGCPSTILNDIWDYIFLSEHPAKETFMKFFKDSEDELELYALSIISNELKKAKERHTGKK